MEMRRIASALVALIALTSPSAADTIDLLCGFYYGIIDTADKSIAIKSPTLDPATRDYLEVAFKDGRREQINDRGLPREYREYVWISDDTIDFAKQLPNRAACRSHFARIDRRTGLVVGNVVNANTCASLPAKRLF